MSDPVRIQNDPDTMEISAAEYKAVIDFGARLAEQNDTLQKSILSLRDEMVAQGENLVAVMSTLKDALAGLNIVVNVPQQPPAVIEFQPQITVQPAGVTVQEAEDGPKNYTFTVTRDARNLMTGGTVREE